MNKGKQSKTGIYIECSKFKIPVMDNERRLQLYELNIKAWSGYEVFPIKEKKFDSSIKRNTGFIKKLKQGITKDSKASLLKDLDEVSLEKYLSEIINTAAEGLANVPNKNEDAVAAIEVVSKLHQRFGSSFTSKLFELFLHNFSNPEGTVLSDREEILRVNKLKANLRVFTELYLVGVFTTLNDIDSKSNLPLFIQKKLSKGEPVLVSLLKEILNYQFKLGFTTTIATSFMKKFPEFSNDENKCDSLICDVDLKSLLKSLFKLFTEAVFNRASDLNKRMGKLKKEHEKCQIRTGKIMDEFLEEYSVLEPIYERFKLATLQLADFFNINPPVFESHDDPHQVAETIAAPVIVNGESNTGQKVWENDDTRKFYESLCDVNDAYKEYVETKGEANVEDINNFFVDIENAETKELIDEAANSYWEKCLDNKATRKRIVKFLIETQDWSKLRLYARFLATNAKYFPEIIEEIISYLDNGFRYQLHSTKINVKNIIFFCEMVKFTLIPTFMIFHKIRTLLLNLQVPNNIEILTVVFEHLGIFLINKDDYKPHMEKMIKIIKDKKKDRQLNMNLKSSLENLINLVHPPLISQLNVDAKPFTPEQHFYHTLIRREIANFKRSDIMKLLEKADWQNNDMVLTLFDLFTKPEYVSYQNMGKLARVLKELTENHNDFVVKCIDEVLENIERGLELNHYGQNMHRVAQVKYLSELYNCKLISPHVLIDTVYNILKFRHTETRPFLLSPNEHDVSDNYFRIQLITTVLLNITRFPTELSSKLQLLLRFLEYYSFTKDQPLPKEIRFKIESTFDKYSGKILVDMERSSTFWESATKLAASVQSDGTRSAEVESSWNTNKSGINSDLGNKLEGSVIECKDDFNLDEECDFQSKDYPEDKEDMESVSDSSEVDGDELEISDADESEDEDEDEDDEDEDDEGEGGDEDDYEDDDGDEIDEESEDDDSYRDIDAEREVERKRIYEQFQKKLRDEEERKAEAEMEKQFQQMMNESIDSRKNEKMVSSNIPVSAVMGDSKKPVILARDNNQVLDRPQKVTFTFLSKSGKKTQSRKLNLPSNIDFVSGVIEEGERLKDEREKIKNIVLQRTFD